VPGQIDRRGLVEHGDVHVDGGALILNAGIGNDRVHHSERHLGCVIRSDGESFIGNVHLDRDSALDANFGGERFEPFDPASGKHHPGARRRQ
jgi:hypothetical protein